MERKKKKNPDQEEIKDLKAIDFLLSHCMCLFWRLLCFNVVYQKDCNGFSGGRGSRSVHQTQRKLIKYRAGIIKHTSTFYQIRKRSIYCTLCLSDTCFPPLEGLKQPNWEEVRKMEAQISSSHNKKRYIRNKRNVVKDVMDITSGSNEG